MALYSVYVIIITSNWGRKPPKTKENVMDNKLSWVEFLQMSIVNQKEREFDEETGELRGIYTQTVPDKEQERYYYFDQEGEYHRSTHEEWNEAWSEIERTQGKSDAPRIIRNTGGGTTPYFTESGNENFESEDPLKEQDRRWQIPCDVTDTMDPVYQERPVYWSYKRERSNRMDRILKFVQTTRSTKALYQSWYRFNKYLAESRQRCVAKEGWHQVYLTKDQASQVYAAYAERGIQGKNYKNRS